MASLNSKFIEFEFLINSTINIFTENNKQYILIPENKTSIIAYQNWNVKTPDANDGDRLVFPYSNKKLIKASNNIRESGKKYEPTVLLTIDKKHFLFSIDELQQQKDYSIILPINNKIHYGLSPPDGDNLTARLNLSTIPYNFLDYTIDEFSYYSDVELKGYENIDSEYPTFSFLLEGEAQSISTSPDGKTQKIYFNLGSGLFPYEQWSINHQPEYTREVDSLSWDEAIKQTDDYNNFNTNHKFTPTVLLEINNKIYLGVILKSEIIDVQGGTLVGGHLDDLTTGKMVEVTIDTTRMKKIDYSGNTSLAMLPTIETPTDIFMNIDNPPGNGAIEFISLELVENQGRHFGQINGNEELIISATGKTVSGNNRTLNFPGYSVMPGIELSEEDLENLPGQPNILINHGKIRLQGTSLAKDYKSFINIEYGILLNAPGGEICIDVDEVDSDIISSYIEGGTIVNYGLIRVTRPSVNVTGSKGNDFTFINSQVVNYGCIRFPIVTNDSAITVTGINKVILNSTGVKGITMSETAAKQDELEAGLVPPVSRMLSEFGFRKGTIIFNGLQSKMAARKEGPSIGDRIIKPTNMTIGIKTVLDNNTGTIIFGKIINGLESYVNFNSSFTEAKNDLINQSTVGILYMGAVDDGNYYSKTALKGNLNANHGAATQMAVPHYVNQFLPENMTQKLDFKLTNPHYNNYDIDSTSNVNTDPNIKSETSNVMGCGYASVIYIGTVFNNTLFENDETLMGACGIFNHIQIDNTAVTYIDSVENVGYGGISACMGICNLLVNYGQIHISVVKNICLSEFNGINHSTCSGILNVVQNGYNIVFDNNELIPKDRKQLQRSTLPPFPPVHYDVNGTPLQSDIEHYPGYYEPDIPTKFSDLMTVDTFHEVNEMLTSGKGIYTKELFMRIYKQGHISINHVITTSRHNEIAVGIKQYGGLSFDSNIMEDAPGLLNYPPQPLSISSHMKNYVNKYTAASTVWAYPTSDNIRWNPPVFVSSLLAKTYPPDFDNNYLSRTQLEEIRRRDGWHETFSNPVQMYFKYHGGDDENTQDLVTDTIFFPINWGIVTINYVVSGGYTPIDPTLNPEIKGSAYGLEKVISCMGTMQINTIESNIQQENISYETEASVLINTNDNPELSRAIYGASESGDDYLDLPIKYAFGFNVTHIENQSINDLPINIVIDSGDIADPTNRIEGIWTTGTQTSTNMRWPYHITNKQEIADPNHHVSHYDLDSEFSLPGGFSARAGSSANNLLETLLSPGAAYGCLRTIDYGSNAPGLQFLRSWTTPIRVIPDRGDIWNHSDTIVGNSTYGGRSVPNSYYGQVTVAQSRDMSGHLWTLCGRDRAAVCASGGDNHELDPRIIRVDQRENVMSGITPLKSSLRTTWQNLHYNIGRKPLVDGLGKTAGAWAVDYLHYPFKPRGGKNTSFIASEGGQEFTAGKGYANNERYGEQLKHHPSTITSPPANDPDWLYLYPLYRTRSLCEDWWYGCTNGPGLIKNTYGVDKSLVNANNPWIGVKLIIDRLDSLNSIPMHTETILLDDNCSQTYRNFVENPIIFNPYSRIYGHVIGTDYILERTPLDYNDNDFTDAQQNPSLYIYNNAMIGSRLALGYHKDVFNPPFGLDPHLWTDANVTWNKPNKHNGFHGATPFPWSLPNSNIAHGAPDLDAEFGNLDYSTRTFQDYIPLCETILFNPACYPIHNPQDYTAPGGYTYIMNKPNNSTDRNIIDFESKTIEHDMMLNTIYPTKTSIESGTSLCVLNTSDDSSMPSHFNTIVSGWVYDDAIRILYEHYFGNNVETLIGVGRTGPLNSVYYTYPGDSFDHMRNCKDSCVANFLSYGYSSTKPIGFNPQLIRGGYWKLREDNPNKEELLVDAGTNNPGFSVVSRGKEYVRHLVPAEDLSIHPFTFADHSELNRLTHDSEYVNKYTTNNSYYGFSYETRNPNSKLDYLSYEMVEGAYSRYIGIEKTVENLMYTYDDNAEQYTSKIENKSAKNQEKREKEAAERAKRQASGAWSLLANFIMMLVLTRVSH